MGSLERSIQDWYDEVPSRKVRLDDILSGKAGFSLREIDHFVTNMAARKPVVFVNPANGKVVDVNNDYRDILRCYHKAGFDSFKRGGGLDLKQRNFFRWAMENGIVDYVAAHVREISQDILEMRKQSPATKRHRANTPHITIVQQTKSVDIPQTANIIW